MQLAASSYRRHGHALSAKSLLHIGLVAGAYLLSYRISDFIPDDGWIFTSIWPPSGVGLATLLLSPFELWPLLGLVLFAVGYGVGVFDGPGVVGSIGFATSNTLESVLGALLIRQLAGGRVRLRTVREVLGLLAVVFGVNAVTAVVGAAAAVPYFGGTFWGCWVISWTVDGMGLLLVTPLILTWSDWRPDWRAAWSLRTVEASLFFAVWGFISYFTFDIHHANIPAFEPFVLNGLLVWAALRLGPRGTATALVVLAGIVLTSDRVSTGPLFWGGSSFHDRLLLAQLFLVATAISGLVFTAAYAERTAAEHSARRNAARAAAVSRRLRENRELLHAVVESSQDRIYAKDQSGRFTLVNSALSSGLGCRPIDMIGNVGEAFLPPAEFHLIRQFEQQAMQSERPLINEDQITCADGVQRTFECHRGPLRNEAGEVIGMFDVARDISERKEAELRLREARDYADQLIETAPIAIVTYRADGQALTANAEAAKLIGTTVEMLKTQNFRQLSSWRESDLLRLAETALASGQPQSGEIRGRTTFGNEIWWFARLVPFQFGDERHLLAMVNDVREQRHAEEELHRYREHLEELVEQRTREVEVAREQTRRADRLASLGTFAAGIAHEINNPLGIMLLTTDVALRKIDQPAAVAALLQQHQAMIRRCGHIAQSVLGFSRQRASLKSSVPLNDIVGRGVDLARKAGGNRGVEIRLQLKETAGAVQGNALELEQVVVNLVHNALQACAPGGLVEVSTRAERERVQLVVADNGCGMLPEQVERMFDPFYTTRLDQGGSGLGLSVVHGIVSDHEGTIAVASEPGRGTRITVELRGNCERENSDVEST